MRFIFNTLILFFLVSSSCFAQKINWLTESEFEKAINKKDSNFFILVLEESSVKDNSSYLIRQQRELKFLEDETIVNYLNNNFACFKFDVSQSKSILFNGKQYSKFKQGRRVKHEFTSFLVGSEVNSPSNIVLRNKKFELLNFEEFKINYKEKEVLIEAEKQKLKYLKENLTSKNKNILKSQDLIKRFEFELENANEITYSKSVFPARKVARDAQKVLEYFVDEYYKKLDLKTFLLENK
tara:strand:+ start:680 stop:1396 length:717 start_codon:yes stop_codon:yes gene_type:complete